MSVLAIRHAPFEHMGYIADAFDREGVSYRYLDTPAAPPPLDGVTGLVIMGGPMSANDDLSFLRAELRLIERAAARNVPILGICLGSQLIAKALGGRVYPNAKKEIGWYDVHWTEAAARDPLFRDSRDPETVFQWHGETFDLPAGAEWLAWSEACRHQAFRVGSNIYGLQFHLEVTPEMIAAWLKEDLNCGDVGELTEPVDAYAHAIRQREFAGIVFQRWTHHCLAHAE